MPIYNDPILSGSNPFARPVEPRPVPTAPSVIPTRPAGTASGSTTADYLSGAATYTASAEEMEMAQLPIPGPADSIRYSSVARVVQAYEGGQVTYNEAVGILMNQFGFSNSDAEDALGVEASTILNPPNEIPMGEPVVMPDPSPPAGAPEAGGAMFDFQPGGGYELVGAAAIFALAYWLSKQG